MFWARSSAFFAAFSVLSIPIFQNSPDSHLLFLPKNVEKRLSESCPCRSDIGEMMRRQPFFALKGVRWTVKIL